MRKTVWTGKNRLNLVFRVKPLFIASFDPSSESLNILIIPEGTFIEAIHGYGPYRAESLVKLGEMEGYGGDFLAGSLQEYLGLPVDGYVLTGGQSWPTDDAGAAKKLIVWEIVKLLEGRGETNLSAWDLLKLGWQINWLRGNRVNLFNLAEMTVFSEITLPDGSQAAKIDTARLENIISRLFFDEEIRNEGLSIVVLNGTHHVGLASQAAKIISNIGGQVIGLGGFEEADHYQEKRCETRSLVKYKESYTVKKLNKIFGCSWGGEERYQQRAEVVLVTGEDYWRHLNLP